MSKSTTQFATKGALKGQTPKWATYLFGSIFLLTTSLSIWISGTTFVSELYKIEWMLALKVFDALVLGFTQLFGIVVNTEKINLPENE